MGRKEMKTGRREKGWWCRQNASGKSQPRAEEAVFVDDEMR
jgi:hypothetical protein